MNKQLKDQVRDILESSPQSRNSDTFLILSLYQKYFYLPDPVSHSKLFEVMQYAKPDDIVRIRRKFNSPLTDPINYPEGRFLPTDPKIFKERFKRIVKYRKELGYEGSTQNGFIMNNQLNKEYQQKIFNN